MLLAAILTCLAFINFFGQRINDKYAKEQLEKTQAVFKPDDSKIKVVEKSKYVGENPATKRFVVVSALVIKSSVSKEETESYISSVPELEGAVVYPYNGKLANELEFTGIQKELHNMTDNEIIKKGYYILILENKPKTILDKRHHLFKAF